MEAAPPTSSTSSTSSPSSSTSSGKVTIRRATRDDNIETMSSLVARSFGSLVKRSGLPDDLASYNVAFSCVKSLVDSYVIVAVDQDSGTIIGYNALDGDADDKMAISVGPIAVDPERQSKGAGKQLMQQVIKQGQEVLGIRSLRLVVNAHNPAAFALYVSLGFVPRMTLAVVTGALSLDFNDSSYARPSSWTGSVSDLESGSSSSSGEGKYVISQIRQEDIDECCELSRKLIGLSRRIELEQLVKDRSPAYEKEKSYPWLGYVVRERSRKVEEGESQTEKKNEKGVVVGYTSGFNIISHVIAENEDIGRLLMTYVSARSRENPGDLDERLRKSASGQADEAGEAVPNILVPIDAQPEFLRWSLAGGCRIAKTMILMCRGEYQAPIAGSLYIPSIMY